MEYIWLEEPVHKNYFGKFAWDENPEISDTLLISFDGSIMAVARNKVEPFYKSEGVAEVRLGLKAPPKPVRNPKFEDVDSVYKMLAYYVAL